MRPGAGLRAEDGMALPMVMCVLFVLSILAAGSLSAAIATSTSSNTDHLGMRAFAAADAGVDAAVFRLAGVTPAPTAVQCLTTLAVAVNAAGECPETAAESLGNDASFRYTASVIQVGSAGCAALPGAAAGASYRCVTSTGTAGGVSRRVQARVMVGVAAAAGGSGLIGTNSVLLNNATNAFACGTQPPRIGSNASVRFVNASTLRQRFSSGGACAGVPWAVEVPAGTSTSYGNAYSPNPMTQVVRATPWVIPAVDFAPSRTTNDNDSLNGPGYTAATRALVVTNGTRTLQPGTYNLCSLTVPNGGTIHLPQGNQAGRLVKIFIDSPDRAGSGCPAGTGRLDLINGVRFNAPSNSSETELATRAKNLEVYVYASASINRGTGSPASCDAAPDKQRMEVVMCNAIDFAGTIHGPTSRILLNNAVTMTGAVAAQDITLWNAVTFERPDGLGSVFGSTGAANSQTAWAQCQTARTTPADPESGCAA